MSTRLMQRPAIIIVKGYSTDAALCLVAVPLQWLVGLAVLICGHLLTFASLSFASQGLVAVLGSFSLVTNVPFSAALLKERFHLGHAVSVALLISGSTLVILFSSRADQDWSEAQLVELFGGAAFLVVVVAFALLLAAAIVVQRRSQPPADGADASSSEEVEAPAERAPEGSEGGDSDDGGSGDTADAPAAWLCAAAIGGAFSFLFAKCLSQVLRAWEQAQEEQDATVAFPWLFALASLLGVAVTGGSSLWALNHALRRGRAGSVIPFYFAAHTALTMVLGVAFFKEYEGLGWLEALMLTIGVVIVSWGVIVGNAADRHGRDAALRWVCPRAMRNGSAAGEPGVSGGSPAATPLAKDAPATVDIELSQAGVSGSAV